MATPDGRGGPAAPGTGGEQPPGAPVQDVPVQDVPGQGAGSAREETVLPTLDRALGGDVPFRPLSIAEILDGAIACIRRSPKATLGPALVLTTVIQVGVSLGAYLFVGREARDEITPSWLLESLGTQFVLSAVMLVLSAFAILLMTGLLAPAAARGLFDLPVTLRGLWRDARPRGWRTAGMAALVTLLPVLALLVPLLPFVLLLAAGAHPAAVLLVGFVSFPVGFVLMVWVYVLLVAAVPAVVMERETAGGALRRAFRLSRGRWWRTCGVLTVAGLITIVMGMFALRVPFLVVEGLFFGGTSEAQQTGALAVDTLGRIVSWTIVIAFDAGVIALLYMDRRMRREGFDLELRLRPNGVGGDLFTLWRPRDRRSPAPPGTGAPHPEAVR